ncbi:conserved membrane hypothetical protein [Tenacibaculum litopenaei]|uniref:vitamin K epoxide reductase family protein n=1 Tax=Tenacibaculum litopenaei TaxID=396016 RepID=UPI0038954B44
MKNSISSLVAQLLRKNKIPFDKEELDFQIQSHPSYPSLHAITGVLDHFSIENIAADIPVNKETLVQLPPSYMAQVKSEREGSELVIVERKGTNYTLYPAEGKKESMHDEMFLQRFTGIIVAVEKTDTVEKPKTKNTLSYLLLAGFMTLVAAVLFVNSAELLETAHWGLSVVGLVVSLAIFKQELGLQSTIGNAFCSGVDDKKDCDAVLTSKGAEIFKGVKLSDLSMLYFGVLSIAGVVLMHNLSLVYAVSLLAIPMTVYSIYYQYAVVKKWCMLCLSLVAVLWVQAALSWQPFINEFSWNLIDGLVFALIGVGSIGVWKSVKPLLVEVTSLRKSKIENVKFKRNYGIFETLLRKSPVLQTEIPGSEEIVFGNPMSSLELVIVTNPFCGHCKPVHKQVDALLARFKNFVKIKIRFNVPTGTPDADVVKITSRLLEIYKDKGQHECLKAMNEIYEKGNAERWLQKWGSCAFPEHQLSELERQNNWCADNAINFTPEILINGMSYPKEYDRSDLIFFIEELEESSAQAAKTL